MNTLTKLAALGMLSAGAGQADTLTDTIISDLQTDGYSYIEVKRGINQIKVEAVQGKETLEVVYDRATGAVIKTEIEPTEARDLGRSGVRVRDRARDFVDNDGDDDNDRRNRGRGGRDDDDDDDRRDDDRDDDWDDDDEDDDNDDQDDDDRDND
ncbi:MAG: PepSY domain-containing protein [Pseudomonadota bacterium]